VVNRLDENLARYSARLPRTAADPALRELSQAANHSLLWLAVAAGLATRPGPTRRGALRGIAAITGASAAANLIAKPLFPRRRPAAELIPQRRRVIRWPISSSFPSGHAASAAAFVTGVTLEAPVAGALLAPLAAAVAYSRVHTGVHWPSDVMAGAALGVGVGEVTKRWWPIRVEEPAAAPTLVTLPALPGGAGLAVLVNPSAGGTEDPTEAIRAALPAAALQHLAAGADPTCELRRLAGRAGALGVAGGDGTVSAAAAVAAERGLPLAVVPTGTLNHFARDLGTDLDGLRQAVAAGRGAAVGLATVTVDGGPPAWFVNTASLGGYPDMVRIRERLEGRLGKWLAAGIALAMVLWRAQPLRVDLDGRRRELWLLFVGNGSYQPKGLAPAYRPRLDSGLLDVRYLRADLRWSRARFLLAVLLGALHRSRTYVQRDSAVLEVAVHSAPVQVATDGEVGLTGSRFRFAARPAALAAYRLG
jgi:diacylglycerol kinase family enzyme